MLKSNFYYKWLIFIFFLISVTFVESSGSTMKDILKNIRHNLKPIEQLLDTKQELSESYIKYKEFYNFPLLDGVEHKMGTLQSNGFSIALNIMLPENMKKLVVVVHGYMEHSGINTKLYNILLQHKIGVIAYDMPGHGLSSGERYTIDSFSTYAEVFRDVKDFAKKYFDGIQISFIAHSTGCAAILEYLSVERDIDNSVIILVSPLVHSQYFLLSKIAYNIGKYFFNKIIRKEGALSHDEKFHHFIRHIEPMREEYVPMSWIKELYEWNNTVESWHKRDVKLNVITGTDDVVVDWEWNIIFLKDKFPKCNIIQVKDGRHALLNESLEYRKQVFDTILKAIK